MKERQGVAGWAGAVRLFALLSIVFQLSSVNPAEVGAFSLALNQNINTIGTQFIQGAYRNVNNSVTFYLNTTKRLFMVNDIKFLDKINLQKYIYLFSIFLLNKISASVFVEYFLHTRRNDEYWMSSSFADEVDQILNAVFLDVDEYNPDKFFDPNDVFNIDEKELRKRIADTLGILNKLTEID